MNWDRRLTKHWLWFLLSWAYLIYLIYDNCTYIVKNDILIWCIQMEKVKYYFKLCQLGLFTYWRRLDLLMISLPVTGSFNMYLYLAFTIIWQILRKFDSRPTAKSGVSKKGWFSLSSSSCWLLSNEEVEGKTNHLKICIHIKNKKEKKKLIIKM